MPTVITGTDGINQVQAGAVESGDLPAGSVIQVVQTNKLDTFSSGVTADIPGLSVSITPSSSSNNILVFFSLNYSSGVNAYFGINLKRNGNRLSVPSVPGDRYGVLLALTTLNGGDSHYKLNSAAMQYLDSPSTSSSITYQLEIFEPYLNRAATINRPFQDDNDEYSFRGTSHITAMEIAG